MWMDRFGQTPNLSELTRINGNSWYLSISTSVNIIFQSRIISNTALKLCNTVVSKSCQVQTLALVQRGFLLLSILNTCLSEEPKYLP